MVRGAPEGLTAMDGGYETFAGPTLDFTGLNVQADPRGRVVVANLAWLSVEIAAGNVAVPLDPAAPPVPDVAASPPLERAAFFAHASMLICMAARGQDPGPHFWTRSRLKQGGAADFAMFVASHRTDENRG